MRLLTWICASLFLFSVGLNAQAATESPESIVAEISDQTLLTAVFGHAVYFA